MGIYLRGARWGQQGITVVTLIGLQALTQEEGYSQAVIRVCVDRTGAVDLVDGEPAGEGREPYPFDYVVTTGTGDDAVARVDDELPVEDATC